MIFIKRIDEPDFGCEGVPDNEVICDKVTFDIEGKEVIANIPEKIVWEYKLDENMEITLKLYNEVINLCK